MKEFGVCVAEIANWCLLKYMLHKGFAEMKHHPDVHQKINISQTKECTQLECAHFFIQKLSFSELKP